jgi:tetratricopeptide (TPR) repeat protein
MSYVAGETKDPRLLIPVLEPAIAATKDNEEMAAGHKKLLVHKALYIEKDKAKAFALKKETMKEGWMEDHKALNGIAWWSFENEIDLAEAEKLARKGAQLAPAGADKAMVLDTLGEILFAQGKKDEAVAVMEQAVKEHPEKKHYQMQLDRFRGGATGTN